MGLGVVGVALRGEPAHGQPQPGLELGRSAGAQQHVVHAPVGRDHGQPALGDDEQHRHVGAGGPDQSAQVAGVRELLAPVDEQQVDLGRQDLAHARDLCRLIRTTGTDVPVLLIVTEGGLAVVAHDWGMDDVVLHTCGPAELEARIKLAIGRLAAARDAADPEAHVIRSGEVVVDDATYTAKIGGRPLDLTFKEFELLKFLAQHPGRVFSRQQLLQEVWGYDYFGGTRTVDVHVRRLRAKLGPENETLIGTVRNVGYRFVLPAKEKDASADARAVVEGVDQDV